MDHRGSGLSPLTDVLPQPGNTQSIFSKDLIHPLRWAMPGIPQHALIKLFSSYFN